MEIGHADEDAAFDRYMDEHPEAIWEELGIASDSNDSEETADRKRDKRANFENNDGFAPGSENDSDF
jgi:hypothetical protein